MNNERIVESRRRSNGGTDKVSTRNSAKNYCSFA
jgi:hypothetical protein